MAAPDPVEEAVRRCAAPVEARTAFESLAESRPGSMQRLESDANLLEATVAVIGASRSLTRVIVNDERALDVLADLDHPPAANHRGADALVRWKRLELLRIAARDLVGLDELERVGYALSDLADAVLAGARRLALPDADAELEVVGMGKLGARELNYASDVDIIFVGDPGLDRQARDLMSLAGASFRVDANLRPEGRSGPLVRSVSSFVSWWDRWALAWETQALLKARPVCGPPELGETFMGAVRHQLWGKPFGADELRQVRDMKARAERHVASRGLSTRELKRGPGGLRDVEFSVQLLQLVHGRHDPALRRPATLDALAELGRAGFVDPDDARALDGAYRFLRTVEHRLQLVEEAQTHTVPENTGAREHLARVMGYRDHPSGTALSRFDQNLARCQGTVRAIHERLFFRPLLEAFAASGPQDGGPALPAGAVAERLSAFGFRDVERTQEAFVELTSGLTRTSRLMDQMLPILLDWLARGADPDLGLLGLRNLASRPHVRQQLLATFRESPLAAQRLCVLLGTSRLLADPMRHHPDLIAALGDDDALVPRPEADLAREAGAVLDLRKGQQARRRGLLRLREAAFLRIAARDVLDLDDLSTTEHRLTELADALVSASVARLDTPLPLAVMAMGRFGGAELSYASDLDVIVVCGDGAPDEVGAAGKAVEGWFRTINGATPVERVYRLDADLRPEGRAGPLVRTISSARAWYGSWAEVWELQALSRARPVAGDAELNAAFLDLVGEAVWQRPFTDGDRREIRRMKARIEAERLPAGEDAQFHLKLGRGSLSDVEWTAQLLQMEHGVRATGTMAALDALVAAGAMSPADAAVLADSYRFCERTRNRWYLVGTAPGDALPTQPDRLARLARSLGFTPVELREEYRRVTRRARQVVERLFYGIEA